MASSFCQYPRPTLGLRIQISPTWCSGSWNAGFRFDDQHFFVGEDPSAADQQTFVLVAGRHGNHAVFIERLAVESPDRGRLFHVGTRDDERRLGHAVAGEKCFFTETDRRKPLAEIRQASPGESAPPR